MYVEHGIRVGVYSTRVYSVIRFGHERAFASVGRHRWLVVVFPIRTHTPRTHKSIVRSGFNRRVLISCFV